jgi:hypothetical protein
LPIYPGVRAAGNVVEIVPAIIRGLPFINDRMPFIWGNLATRQTKASGGDWH